jgi:hypothetical protein
VLIVEQVSMGILSTSVHPALYQIKCHQEDAIVPTRDPR